MKNQSVSGSWCAKFSLHDKPILGLLEGYLWNAARIYLLFQREKLSAINYPDKVCSGRKGIVIVSNSQNQKVEKFFQLRSRGNFIQQWLSVPVKYKACLADLSLYNKMIKVEEWYCRVYVFSLYWAEFGYTVKSQAVDRSTIQRSKVQVQMSQYIRIKFPLHKESENPWACY